METCTRVTAGENEDVRIDNEPLDPELRGDLHLPGTSTYMTLGAVVKADLLQ